jgi:ATP-dependent helicase/nuclease subunit A
VRRSIRKSFRAIPALLAFANDLFDAVDKVTRPDAFEFGAQDRFPISDPDSTGDAPLGLVIDHDPDVCAARVASEIAGMIGSAGIRDRHTGLTRPVSAGDIAILFRSREGHQAFARALEARGVPAYVYKGLGFFDADEVKDVIALLRYLADPASDIRAAAFARSRFVRLSDPALQALAPRVAEALRQPVTADSELGAEDRAVLGETRRAVERWVRFTDWMPPSDLLEAVLDETAYLYELRGQRAAQAIENLKKMRSLVRRIQNRGYATMARVAAHIERLSAGDESNAVIDAVDAVNLMTVHAAKGLEFPVVFVVNLGKGSGGSRPPIRLVGQDAAGEPSVAVGDYESDADADIAARELEETKRLLYVSVTRARDRLYLAGVAPAGQFAPARGSLGDVLPASLLAVLSEAATTLRDEVTWQGPGGVHRFRVSRESGTVARQDGRKRATPRLDLDEGLVPAPTVRDATTTVRRQHLAAGARDGAPDANCLAGTLVHRLLEQVEHAAREDEASLTARLYSLTRASDRAPRATIEAAVPRAAEMFRGMLARPAVRDLLERGERLHEVPFSVRHVPVASGILPTGGEQSPRTVHGTIDTLVRTPGRVVVVEFKTGQRLPEHDVQLAGYLDAARALFPNDSVAGVLVYADRDVWFDETSGAAS